MQIKVKTLDKKELVIEVEGTEQVKDFKKKIQEAKGNEAALDPSISKLIWKGKILQNDQSVQEAGINDKGFCVIMPGKVQASSSNSTKPAESSSKSETTENKPSTSAPTQTATTAAATTQAAATPAATTPAATTTTAAATPAAAIGSAEDPIMQLQAQLQLSDELISNVVAVSGFAMDKVKLALTVAQGNPDLAVELIMSNNLEPAVAELRRRLQGGASAQQSGGSSENTGTPDSITSGDRQVVNESNPLHYLTQNQMGQQMIAAIRQNPAILPQILQQISQTNPELFQQLQQNHEAFLQLLEGDGGAAAPVGGQQQGGASASGAPAAGGQQRVELQITQADREAIDRLMGISQKSEVEVVQAYMACDKNEEHALNLLFDS